MAHTIKLTAEARESFGKGAARRIRRENKIPAVIYSNGETPDHIVLPGHEAMLALRQANALLDITMPNGDHQLALPKLVQRHPVRDQILHVDLLKVERGEKVSVQVPISVVGESAPDTLVNHDVVELSVLADATDIPTGFEVSVDGLEVGAQIVAGDIALPAGVELDVEADLLLVSITAALSEEQLEAELETPGEGDEAEEAAADAE